jgi:hypothetical protein
MRNSPRGVLISLGSGHSYDADDDVIQAFLETLVLTVAPVPAQVLFSDKTVGN